MYRLLQEDFIFVATSDMESWRKEQGWELKRVYPYEIKSEENIEAYQQTLTLAKTSDVIILGSAPETYLKERMLAKKGVITFRYSERVYKRGRWRMIAPRGLWIRAKTYFRYYPRKIYMLCASAYTSADLMLQGSYLGKCYKWGYFPETIHYNINELMERKARDKIKLLWCGRLITWKHPEIAILLASRLKNEGYNFVLHMIGTGEEENRLKALISEHTLEAYVELLGSRSPEQVRQLMEETNIFLFTSDYQEGWGAVLNEAMNSGCAVVASHAGGAVPYLIQAGKNGLIYKNGDFHQFYQKVIHLMKDRDLCYELGKRAYETIINEWNAQVAAKRLLLLIDDLQHKGVSDRFVSGPCSKAEIIWNNWYRD